MAVSMADIIKSIPSVAGSLVGPIGPHLGYLFNYRSNLDDLKNQLDKLGDMRGRMERSVNAARRNGKEIEPDVEKWLESVNRITEKAEEISREDEGCFNGLCPNLKSRYQLSKKAKKTGEEVVVEIRDGEKKLGMVAYDPAPQGGSTLRRGYESFASRMSTLNEIMEALGETNINMIGVYGMGGVGKTMLVEEAARKAMEDHRLFDKKVTIVVSRTPNIRKIQEEIAYPLGLEFDAQEIGPKRFDRLCERLKQEKSILIILDDVWAKLDLEALGIPLGDMQNGCKIVVTSRRLLLLSKQMNIKNNFGIGQLLEEEAWNLFKKMAGDCVEDSEIKPTAVKVAKECAGLPIAIAVVATALKNESSSNWKSALHELETAAPTTIEEMDERVYKSLRWSYDFLNSEAARKLFLLCSLLPEDYQFSIQELLYYGKGVGLFQGIEALEKARNIVHALVDHLKASCLLLDGKTSGLFKMHDVVRDVGISIASKDKKMLLVRNKIELEEWMTEEQLKSCSAISLPYVDIHELPTGFESPALKFFLFFSKDRSSKIPDTFFEEMKQLKVLTLRRLHFSSLHFPSSLQTLCLDECLLGDISIIGELKNLEILTFRHSDIEELPREIGQLTRLKLLDLRECYSLEVIPPNVIASLSQLEELYMRASFKRWEVDGNASLAELKQLTRLVTLEIYIRDANILPNDLVFEKLTRYQIFIGDFLYFRNWFNDYEISRTLNLAVNTSIHLLSGINKLLKRTEDLHLEELNGFKSILNDSDGEGFHDTRRLHVKSSSEIEYVIDTSVPFSAFPKLESLLLFYLINLKEICHGQLTAESFCNLRKVKVEECVRLQNLFPLYVARRLSKLQEIEIHWCKNMDGIVAEGREASEDNNGALFPQLRSLKLRDLPELVSFRSKVKEVPCTSDAGSKEIISISEGENGISISEIISISEGEDGISISEGEDGISIPLFNEKDTFPNLEKLDIASISMKEIWHSQLPDGSFCNLRMVKVRQCGRLQNLFPLSVARRLSKLQEIEISACWNMDGIVAEGREAAEDNNGAVFPQLRSLTLESLRKLVSFCSKVKEVPCTSDAGSKEIISISEGEHGISIPLFNQKDTFPNLENLDIRRICMKEIWHSQLPDGSFCNLRRVVVQFCYELQNLFLLSVARRLSKLQEIVIWGCKNMDGIVAEGREAAEDNNGALFPQLRSLTLRELPKLVSFCSKVKEVPCTSDAGSKEIISISEGEHGISIPLFNQKVAFPNLEELDLDSLPRLMAVWMKDSQGSLNFQKLGSLHIRNCESLINVFTTSMAQFQDMVEEINEKEAAAIDKIIFPQVKSLTLECVKQLKSFCQRIQISEWPSLKYLKMCECDNVEIFASELSTFKETRGKANLGTPTKQPLFLVDKVAFPNLEELDLQNLPRLMAVWMKDSRGSWYFQKLSSLCIRNCESLINVFTTSMVEEIIEKEEAAAAAIDKIMFPQVKSLTLECLKQLKSFCEWIHISEWPSLEKLKMSECQNVEIFASELSTFKGTRGKANLGTPTKQPLFLVDKAAFPNLEILFLYNLPRLMAVWMKDSQGSLNFQKLSSLDIRNCESLINVFTTSMAQFQDTVEEINEKEAAPIDKIMFPQVKSLTLERLRQLKSFCQWIHISEWPSLEKLKISGCHNVEIFASELSTFKETRGKANLGTPTKQPLFLVDKVAFPNLEEMELNDMSSMEVIWQGQFHAHSFRKLRVLKVAKCDKTLKVFPISLLRNLHNLEVLSVKDCCSLEDVFELEGGVGETEHASTFPPLKNLMLIGLPKLMHLWKEDSQLSAVFQNLTFLEVRSCGSLTHVFPSKRAEGPVQIKSTTVSGDKGEATDETIFSQLYSLKLKDLLNLTSFCSGGNDFSFPSLKEVFVEECPKLKTFSTNTLRTPKLEKVQVEGGLWLWDSDLNTTIQHLIKLKLESILLMAQGVWSNDPASQLEATTQFGKLLSIERSPPIDEVIKAGVVPRFVEFLERQDLPQLQFEAARALANVASGTSEHTRVVIEHGAVPKFVQLLSSASDDVRQQFVIDNQVLPCLYQLLTQNREKSITEEACRTIANITAGNSYRIQAVIKANIILPLVHLLQHAEFDIQKEAARAISNATLRGSHEQIQFLVSQGCIKLFCDLLVCPDPRIVTVCLEGLENILEASEADEEMSDEEMADEEMGLNGGINLYAQMIDECGGLDKLENLQTHDNNEISEKAVKLLWRYWAEKDDEVQNPQDGENGNQ